MTWRAAVLGSMGAVFVCSITYFNDWVLQQTFFIGNHMPVSVYGGLLVFLLFNAFLFRYRRKWAFRRGELALMMGMTLAACSVPASGLMRTFTTTLMLPHHFNKTESGWQSNRLIDELTPPVMLADVTEVLARGKVVAAGPRTVMLETPLDAEVSLVEVKIRVKDSDGYRQVRRIMAYDEASKRYELDAPWQIIPEVGTPYAVLANNEEESLIPFSHGRPGAPRIRWQAWTSTMTFWIPLILCLWLAVIGLSMVVHKQWSHHEQLPYPVARVALTLLPEESGNSSSIFKARSFWISAGLVCMIYLNNFVQSYFPEFWVRISTRINFYPLMKLLDLSGHARWAYGRPTFFFSVIGIAFLLSKDVSLSVGIAPLAYSFVATFLAARGVNVFSGGSRAINMQSFYLFGAYLGVALMIVYTGRRYYLGTARRAFGLKTDEDVPGYAVWGARVCLAGILLFALQAAWIGLAWYVALLYVCGIVMMMMVMSRILVETGLFFIQPYFALSSILIGTFGPLSIGLRNSVVLLLFSAVLAFDPREAIMPFVVNSTKLLDDCKVKRLGRASWLTGLAAVVGLAVAIPVTLHLQHTHGGRNADDWGSRSIPTFAFRSALDLQQRLQQQWGSVGKEQVLGKGILHVQPMDWRFFMAAGIGLAGAMLFAGLRLRFNRWPLHPVIFLVCTSYATAKFGPSFLLGWFIKVCATKYGGFRVRQNIRPIMIGLIVGEILGALLPIVISYLIYWKTGELPNAFSVFPS